MKESIFNISKIVDKDILLYNTFTKSLIRLDNDYWNIILKSLESIDYNHQLVKLGFIVDNPQSQLDCYRLGYLQNCFSNKMLSLVIAPTIDCNLACEYCFEKGNKKSGIMSDEIENKVIEFIKSQNPQFLSITWFGGEPLLAFKRILSISKKLTESGIRFNSSIVTNGTLLSTYVIDNLKYLNLNRIQISMDGNKEDQDSRRCFKNGKPTFNLIIDNIANLLAKTDIKVGIQVTVDHDNEDACKDLNRFISQRFPNEYNLNRITVTQNFVRDRTDMGESSGCYTNEELINHDILSLKNGNPDSISLPDTCLPCMHKTLASYAICPEGNLYKCMEHLGVPEEAVGSLANGKLSINKLANKLLGNDFLESEECRNCNILPICGGGCPVDRNKVLKGLKKESCSMYKSRFADLLPYYYNRKYAEL
jgi:uncharacterized protein